MALPVLNKELHPSGAWDPKAYRRKLIKEALISLEVAIQILPTDDFVLN